jgi:hypothetical protein
MKKIFIIAIAFMPFVIAHAENIPTSDVEKVTIPEPTTKPQTEQAQANQAAEKPKVAKENTPKRQKMGKAGGKGG